MDVKNSGGRVTWFSGGDLSCRHLALEKLWLHCHTGVVHVAVYYLMVAFAQDCQSSTQVFLSLKGFDEAEMPVSRGSLRLWS